MGKKTSIQWCHSTVNPTSGCDGCELFQPAPLSFTAEQRAEWLKRQPCYASQVHRNRLARSFPHNYAADFSEVRMIPGRMEQVANYGSPTERENKDKPWFFGRPRHIFISDMADALSEAVPFDFLKAEIIDNVTSAKGQRHVWQWLTKRPERMAAFDAWLAAKGIRWPANLWAGTSVTSQRTCDSRVPHLLKVSARVRFLSCEPLFGAVTIKQYLAERVGDFIETPSTEWQLHQFPHPVVVRADGIRWVIIGGMSGRTVAPFHVNWAYSLIRECRDAGVTPFIKQLGRTVVHSVQRPRTNANFAYSNPPSDEPMELKDPHGGDWSEWPDSLRVREIPSL